MKATPVSTYVGIWIALMALLALTLASSYVSLGGFNAAVNVAVSCVKAALVAVFFMKLRSSDAVVRFAAGIGVVWFLILVAGTLIASVSTGPG